MDQDLEDQRRTLTTALRERGATDDTIQGAVEVLARGWPTDLDAMFADELLAEALRSFAVHPAWFERRMTGLRRRLLFAPDTLNAGPLLAALAIQCQLNEYAWAEDGAEAHEADRLLARLETLTAEQVMAVACYRRLADHPAADALLAKGWTGPVAEVLGELIVAEREEREISTGLPGLTPIRDGVSSDVRSQYEVNPYPRWRRVPRPDPAWSINGHPVPVRPRVLVAGCGTGRQAIQAHLWLAAEHTLAVDLSRRSLSYAVRKTRESGITGIEYAHGDILELPQHLPEAFDVVTCVGVLHHMSDPFEGARAVCRTLKPGGLLNIGLYSRTARTWLRPARTFAERFTPETVRELRQAVLAAPRGDLLGWPATSRDFYTTSGARDPLMHVQEHQMGFADLRRILDENDLRFMGFIVSEATMAAYRAAFPHDPEGLDLGAWERFETMNPRVFARMYSFWAEKPAAPQPSSATVDTEALPPTLEGWRAPGARRAVLADLRRGVLGVQPPGRPAVAHLRTNWPATDAALAADELLAAVLKATPAYPYWLEGRLTAIRWRLLFGNDVDGLKPILPALASQCFLNEYAWAEDAVERQLVERLAGRLDRLSPDEVMTLACYRPLTDLPGAEALLERGWTGGVAEVLDEQIAKPREERALQAGIPTLTPIRGGASEPVQAQYEANPYPRWRGVTRMAAAESILGWRVPAEAEVLFAGCGTGRHAIHSGQRCGPGARILAIDLSRASLAYALHRSREAGITNIQYAQADLLELGGLGRTFDVIESSGVLHHLDDPFEGARMLASLLRPGGIMKLGLYSRLGRAHWGPAKALASTFAPEAIREARRAIATASPDDPVREAMGTTDFYSTSTFRDLLMHVREHEHAIRDLRQIVQENGLEVLGFTPDASVMAAYRAAFPQDPRGADLGNWEAFERANPRAFTGMYQFWLKAPG